MFSQLWNCNRLWKIWYGILISILQCYVIFNGIRQYINFKSQYYNPRYGGGWDFGPLHFYIGCIIISIALMGFFIYFALINVHCEVCADFRYLLNDDDIRNSFTNIGRSIANLICKKLPYPHILHFILSICLLVPIPVMHMEEIRNEVLSPDFIWGTDIDFFSDHFEWSKADSLPNTDVLRNIHYITKSSTISLEFINFSIASILIILKMPTVFWSHHKCFSIVYSMSLFFNCITWITTYEASSILIKCFRNNNLLRLSKVVTQINYSTILVLIILQFFLMSLSFVTAFAYGHIQAVFAWLSTKKSDGLTDSGARIRKCWITLVIVFGFLLLICTLIVSSIIFDALFRHYQTFKSTIFLVTIIIGIINVVVNFLMWFTFAIKSKWGFKFEQCKTENSTQNPMNQGYKLTGTSDDIYGCFHNNITLSCSSSHSSGPGTMRTFEGASSECCGLGNNFQNYIYMQANTMQIPTISEDYDENHGTVLKSVPSSRDKASTSTFEETTSRGRDIVSISDNGISQSTENINSDSCRSLQLYEVRKCGKLVKFEGMDEKCSEKRFSSNNFTEKELNFLKVPDILNLNRPNLSCSLSESSLDQIGSSTSSKMAGDQSDHGLCSEV